MNRIFATMRHFLLFLFLGTSAFLSAQSVAEIQKEIDAQVWRPFQEAFQELDGQALNDTYAAQVLRVTPGGIDTENSFKQANLKRFTQNKADGISIRLDFWFDSRHTNITTSYEVGFYRIGATNAAGETSYNYGQFHIVLEKIEGIWKITQDWDTTTINGHAIGSEDFAKNPSVNF